MAVQTYLIQTVTGRVYGWSKALADRDDMQPFEYSTVPCGYPDIESVVLAIAELDPSNEEHYTIGGKPDAKVLAQHVGRNVSAAERDAAWGIYQEQAGE